MLSKSNTNTLVAKDGLGQDTEGEVCTLKDLEAEDLLKFVENKIVLTESIDKVSFYKLIALGALGIITKDLTDFDFIDLSERPLQACLFVVSSEDFKRLEQYDKNNVRINAENKNITLL